MNRAWILLFIASLLEILWALCLKKAEGWTNLPWSLAVATVTPVALWILVLAMRSLPVGTAYAVFTGIGAVGTVLIGTLILKEPMSPMKLASFVLVIIGLIGLKLTSPE